MENERPIEKLLRRYANKRRDEAAAKGLELHPATRRMLQGEVSRQFPKPASREGDSVPRLKGWWSRIVWALPVLVVLTAGVWVIVQSQKPPQEMGHLAKLESSTAVQSRESLARTEAAAQSTRGITPPKEIVPTLAEADESRTKDNTSALGLEEAKLKNDRALSAVALNAPAPSSTVPTPEAANLSGPGQEKALADRETSERFARDARADKSRDLTLTARRPSAEEAADFGEKTVRALPATSTDSLAPAPALGGTAGRNRTGAPVSAAAPSTAPQPLSLSAEPQRAKAEYGRAQAQYPTVVQKFVQTAAPSIPDSSVRQLAETIPVLDSFQVEQTGNQLRVTDSDGSSYSGSIQFATSGADATKRTSDLKSAARYVQGARPEELESQAAQNYFFSVTGTNRTLKQPVTFTGNLAVLTNALPEPQIGVTLAPTAKGQSPQGQSGSALLNSTISGKVRLGADKEMQIRAVPVAR